MKLSSLLSNLQLLYQVGVEEAVLQRHQEAAVEGYRHRQVEEAVAVEEERLPLILGAEEVEAAAEGLPQRGLVEAVEAAEAAAEGGLLQRHLVGEAEEEGVVRRLHPGLPFRLPALRRSWRSLLLLLLLLLLRAAQFQSAWGLASHREHRSLEL